LKSHDGLTKAGFGLELSSLGQRLHRQAQ
jgi:hypothetical protein